MAVVIPFAPRRRSVAGPLPAVPRETGAILFFTGVRYERPPEPGAPGRAERKPGPRSRAKPAPKSVRQPA
ncbi:hypothetical protein AB4099_16970 [Bosea sp. 2KB_26]|uniref:hypothetical protein n=1 Tax=Bosea sp. 2KB_26 TaxID=3237475 RepID=UPI003F8FCDE3